MVGWLVGCFVFGLADFGFFVSARCCLIVFLLASLFVCLFFVLFVCLFGLVGLLVGCFVGWLVGFLFAFVCMLVFVFVFGVLVCRKEEGRGDWKDGLVDCLFWLVWLVWLVGHLIVC